MRVAGADGAHPHPSTGVLERKPITGSPWADQLPHTCVIYLYSGIEMFTPKHARFLILLSTCEAAPYEQEENETWASFFLKI